jgi:hypothetical protein
VGRMIRMAKDNWWVGACCMYVSVRKGEGFL